MIVLLRIDDRLIHAQVVIGWGRKLRPDRILVADDEVSESDWEKELYLSASPDIKVSIASVEEAWDMISGGVFDREKVLLLVKGPEEASRLIGKGLDLREVNVGGMHYAGGRQKVLDNVYLDPEERKILREMVKQGITLEARALPGDERVILNSKIV